MHGITKIELNEETITDALALYLKKQLGGKDVTVLKWKSKRTEDGKPKFVVDFEQRDIFATDGDAKSDE